MILLYLNKEHRTVLILIFHMMAFPWVNGFPPNDHSSDHPTPMFNFNILELQNFDFPVPYHEIENIFISNWSLISLKLLLSLIKFLILAFTLILSLSCLKGCFRAYFEFIFNFFCILELFIC